MAISKIRTAPIRTTRTRGILGFPSHDLLDAVRVIKAGLPMNSLIGFVDNSGLSMAEVVEALQIPPRTLARRKSQGVLSGPESERLLRLAGLYDKTLDLFEGDRSAALAWLRSPAKALGSKPPLELAETEIGARAVEDLIGRLEFGVYS